MRVFILFIFLSIAYGNTQTVEHRPGDSKKNVKAFQTLPALDIPLDLAIKSAHGNGVNPHVLPHQNCVSHVKSIAGNKNNKLIN